MHENDFQTQLAAVMEILVKAAMRETTKLYETGVLQLRIEMAQIKQENESLKSRLRFSELMWRHKERQEERQGDTVDDPNQKCPRTEADSGPGECRRGPRPCSDPPGPQNGDEEEEEEGMTVLNPSSALKEESPEMEFVLIKQEDSDIEECFHEAPPIQQKRGAVLSGSLAPVAVAPAEGQRTGPEPDRPKPGLRGQGSCGKPAPGRKRSPLPNRGGSLQGETGGGANVLSSPWEMRQDPAEAWPAAPEQQGVGYAPLPPLPLSRYGSSYLTEFARGDQGAQLHDSVSATQRDGCSGDGAEQEGAGYEQEGAGHIVSHQLLHGWSCVPGEPVRALPSDSRQGQQEVSTFQCGQCGRVLSSAVALEAHRSVHTGERPYPCPQCAKAFPSLRGLTRHSHVHSSERPHRCPQCAKTFVYQFSLTKHQQLHSGERAHACPQCGKAFVFKSDLSVHARSHSGETPYRCSLCAKEFRHRRALTMHLQGHTGERRHHCPYCPKSFLDLGNFKRHKRIHTGEKPYGCQLCGKNFTQSAHLKKHFLTHK
ncbi:zinc finger and SCAN domain-containing protein 21-like isoform X1 [Anguilla rostrata]|uniref:zinc finger and SCAN domain-containing protein 21-like isoform X1 n=1 Tax=Anguilla rostrata TaxID=7938 RepID=UPI0030D355C0